MLFFDGFGNIFDIIALVRIGGKYNWLTAQLKVAQIGTGCQNIHLTTRIIDVILPPDLVANRL